MNISKKFVFYIFLIINFICWSVIQLFRNIISIDSMEAISWGELISFGTNKHPPLSGWIMASFYNLFGQHDILVYVLGQICVLVGFIYIYKLAKNFLSEEKAICSVLVLQTCFYYNYYIYVNSFNCNVLLMALWPIVTYYFYNATTHNNIKDWIFFGLFSGLAFLGKYQIVFLFLAMLLYLIIAKREYFKQKGMYLAILVGALTIAPHVVWLFNTDFFSFAYMVDRTQSTTHNMPSLLSKLGHVIYPIKFIGDQILATLSCLAFFLILAIQAKNISINKKLYKNKDLLFLLVNGICPIIFQGGMGLITGARVPGIWGSIMVSLTGILIFYFINIDFKEITFNFAIKLAYLTLVIQLVAVGIFALINTKFFIAYPKDKIFNEFNEIWNIETNNSPIKYIAGHMDYIFQFKTYHPRHPHVILETFGHTNPWVDYDDIEKSGVIVLAKDEDDVIQYTLETLPFVKENTIKPHKYTFDVCNKIGKCKQDEFYYVIVKPKEK